MPSYELVGRPSSLVPAVEDTRSEYAFQLYCLSGMIEGCFGVQRDDL